MVQTTAMATPRRSATSTPVRSREDSHDDYTPTPKKVKTESGHATPRRPALRDVTNEQSRPSSPRSETKKAIAIPSSSPPPTPPTTNTVHVDADDSPFGCARPLEVITVQHDDEQAMASQIYDSIRHRQLHKRALDNYLDDQPEINGKMRSILVDWLIEVHYRLKLATETLFLTVNYLDRYLAAEMVTRKELQLVGLTALFIASKVEEVEPIEIADLVYVCDETYSIDQIIQMERQILAALRFDLIAATSHGVVEYLSQSLLADKKTTHLASFFTHHTLLHLPCLLTHSPSELAAASVYLAQCTIANESPSSEWIHQWESKTEFTLEGLRSCLDQLCATMATPSRKLVALHHKFGTKRFSRVATLPLDSLSSFL